MVTLGCVHSFEYKSVTASCIIPYQIINELDIFTDATPVEIYVASWLHAQFILNYFKERGGGQTFSTSFWMRFSQAPLCRCRFKVIFDDIIFLLSGNIIEYICFWRFNSIIMTRNKWLVFTK